MNTHWTSPGYLHVKTPTGNYSIALEGKEPAEAAFQQIKDANDQIARLKRRIDALSSFVMQETKADPDALRV